MWMTLAEHPALARLPADDRQRLASIANRRAFRQPGYTLPLALFLAAQFAGAALLFSHISSRSRFFAYLTLLLQLGSLPLLVLWLSQLRHRLSRALYQVLLAQNIRPPACPLCDHDLRQCSIDHCPECGAPLPPSPS